MYCSACGSALAPGLSYCNRCGISLKEHTEPRSGLATAAFLIAITLIGIAGMGIMLGGALTLTNEAHLKEELVGFFMLFTFLIIMITEIMLIRQLSRQGTKRPAKVNEAPPLPLIANEFRPPAARALGEPLASVTENTTRTLEYSRSDPAR